MGRQKAVQTPSWDEATLMDNIERQYREACFRLKSLPVVEFQRNAVLEPHSDAKKDIRKAIKEIDAAILNATTKTQFVELRDKKRDALAALELAKTAYDTASEKCPQTKQAQTIRKFLKASTWIRTEQVETIRGALQQIEITDADKDDIAKHSQHVAFKILANKSIYL